MLNTRLAIELWTSVPVMEYVQEISLAQSVLLIVWKKPYNPLWTRNRFQIHYGSTSVRMRSVRLDEDQCWLSISALYLVYRQDVIDLYSAPVNSTLENTSSSRESIDHQQEAEKQPKPNLTSVLILVPLRLGLNELDVIYEPYLKEALKLPQTVGIIGGSPRHAVYMLGFQDDSFIDLDPHFSQNTVNVFDEGFDLSVSRKREELRGKSTLDLLELLVFIAEEVNGEKNRSKLYIGILLPR